MGNKSEKKMDVDDECTYEELLNILDINPETVLVLNNGQAVPLDEIIDSGDLTILKIVSGG